MPVQESVKEGISELPAPRLATTVGSPREWFHFYFPAREPADDIEVLLAGDAYQRARVLATANPRCMFRVAHSDALVLDSLRELQTREGIHNLEIVPGGPKEVVAQGRSFDLIFLDAAFERAAMLEDWLRSLRGVLARDGSLHLNVPGIYGRQGLSLLRRLSSALEIPAGAEGREAAEELLRAVTETNRGETGETEAAAVVADRGLLDQMTRPDHAAYTVEECLAALRKTGYLFQRFLYQAHYLPEAGGLAANAELLADVSALPPEQQWALMELFRGTMAAHELIACRNDRPFESIAIDLDGAEWLDYIPRMSPLTESEAAGLAPGTRMRLRNRGHLFPEISVVLDETRTALCEAIDGRRSARDLVALLDPHLSDTAIAYVQNLLKSLWRFDYVWFRTG